MTTTLTTICTVCGAHTSSPVQAVEHGGDLYIDSRVRNLHGTMMSGHRGVYVIDGVAYKVAGVVSTAAICDPREEGLVGVKRLAHLVARDEEAPAAAPDLAVSLAAHRACVAPVKPTPDSTIKARLLRLAKEWASSPQFLGDDGRRALSVGFDSAWAGTADISELDAEAAFGTSDLEYYLPRRVVEMLRDRWEGGGYEARRACITQAEAARRLGVTRQRVGAMIDSGRLRGLTSGGRTFVLISSVEGRITAMKERIR